MKHKISASETANLLATLKKRFEENKPRHAHLKWEEVEKRLVGNTDKLWSLLQMEETGGAPDVVTFSNSAEKIFFIDCSKESPKGRRSLCYDTEALKSRKKHKPVDSAVSMAEKMKIQLLDERQYAQLQSVEQVDTKTSSWIKTPDEVRKLGGALFGDFRYGRVFTYHNGAESYYAVRGFRGMLEI